jgi:hypothetical protein
LRIPWENPLKLMVLQRPAQFPHSFSRRSLRRMKMSVESSR